MPNNIFKNRIILVTGGTGSIGSEIVSQLLKYEPKQVRILSRNDSKQYDLLERLGHPENLRLFIGDIRDRDRLDLAFQDVDFVFHAAALKHVPICEYNPFEAVKTNIVGSQNIIDMALRHNVKKVIGISTDKAANPTNVMGTSKLMMEKLFANTNFFSTGRTMFSCVRFGNVAWATSSVLPIWKEQVSRHGHINVTHPKMTRFLMSISQAVDLTIKAAELSRGGEIFVLKMPAIRLPDLAKMYIRKYHPDNNIKIKFTNSRPGEKIHEDLLTPSEDFGSIFENPEMFILFPKPHVITALKPSLADYEGFKTVRLIRSYSSDKKINTKKVYDII